MRDLTLVTGASGGIGADLARVFARNGHDLALVARSAPKLDALADEIAALGRPRPLVIAQDLAQPGAVDDIAAALAQADARVTILVNNAGYGLAGAVTKHEPGELIGIVDLNIRALLDLTLRFLPGIIAAKGKILNVASIASYFPGPGMAVYYASKAFVASFSRALSQELRTAGVTVTVLNPGVTETGFQARAGFNKIKELSKMRGVSALSVAEAGYRGLFAGKRVVVPGLDNKLATMIVPLVPDALLLPIIARFQGGRV
jgi:short-subunit dehydrogenase